MLVLRRALCVLLFSFTSLTPWLTTCVRAATADTNSNGSFAQARKMLITDYRHNHTGISANEAMIRRQKVTDCRGDDIIYNLLSTNTTNPQVVQDKSNYERSHSTLISSNNQRYYRVCNNTYQKDKNVSALSDVHHVKYNPVWTVKTNVPYWALVVSNAAVEYHFAPHWSADLPVFYLPFTVARTYRFRVLATQPSARYWLNTGHEGHFFGVHATVGQFNVSVNTRTRYQDKSGMYGGGLDYGYAFHFDKGWGLELNIGAGYLYTRYNKYYNIKNGALYGTDTKNYWGVTRFGVSVTYKLNGKGK